MKILSWNVNGLRATYKKGFLDWFTKAQPDILCLQEVKATQDQLPSELTNIANYSFYTNAAAKKGYSGVAIYTKEKPQKINTQLGLNRFDDEGRLLELKYEKFTLLNLYVPNGGRGKRDLEYKLDFYKHFFKYLRNHKDKNLVLTGDFNIAHQEIDLARPKENANSIMFTQEERKQITTLVDLGFIDTFRHLHKGKPGHYSWWAYYRNLRERNIGWRIDYIFITPSLLKTLQEAFILKEVAGSDHCPVGIELGG